jgi:hypothetical protein
MRNVKVMMMMMMMMMMMIIIINTMPTNGTYIAELKLKWFFGLWMIHYFVSKDKLHCKYSDERDKISYEIKS